MSVHHLKKVVLLVLCLAEGAFAQSGWFDATQTTNEFNSVCFVDTLVGWVTLYNLTSGSNSVEKTTDGGYTWAAQNLPGGRSGFGPHFLNRNVGFAFSDSNTIYKSTNGGTSWSLKSTAINMANGNLRTFLFINSLVGYACGGSVVAKTTDGGESWTAQETPAYDLWDISFGSSQKGLAVGLYGTCIETTDGGTTWTETTPPISNVSLFAVRYLTASRIVVTGGAGISLSTDAGTSWTAVYNGAYSYTSVSFADSANGWAVGGYDILRTTDGGAHWGIQDWPTPQRLVFQADCVDRFHAWVVGDQVLLRTNDGGGGVHKMSGPVLSYPTNSSVDQSCTPFLSWGSADWAAVYTLQVATDSAFVNLVLVDTSLTVTYRTVGPLGASTKYFWRVQARNGPTTSEWSSVWNFTTVPRIPRLIYPPNASAGLLLNVSFSWSEADSSGSYRLQVSSDSTFTTSVLDQIVYGTSYRTGPLSDSSSYFWRAGSVKFDGNTYWSPAWHFSTRNPESVSFPFSIGNRWFYSGTEYKETFTAPPTTVRMGAIREILDTTLTGWRVVRKTTIFRESRNVTAEYWLNRDGQLFESTDTSYMDFPVYDGSIKNDTTISLNLSYYAYHLNQIYLFDQAYRAQDFSSSGIVSHSSFSMGYSIAEGFGVYSESSYYYDSEAGARRDSVRLIGVLLGGVVLGDTDVLATGVAEKGKLPDQFQLQQNFPNPFNPTTVISYQLSAVSQVTLKVYDVLGREVTTLVNRKQNPGSYHVNFDATQFTSGVYFCRLTAGTYSAMMKMLLVK
ncbi:MAG TPA: YCF48-related protein [Candidatus Kryptonia bacterium]